MARPSSERSAPGRPTTRFTVDQLARTAGTTTRQVRALQTQGLLLRPRLFGRTGYYDDGHLDRLRAVLRLQERGFSLAGIAALFRARDAGMTLDEVLGLTGSSAPVGDPGSVDSDFDAFDGWPVGRRGRTLSVVPSTVLEPEAS